MLIKSKRASHISENLVTPEAVYQGRRQLLKSMGFGLGAVTLGSQTHAQGLLDGLFGKDDEPKTKGKFETKPLEFKNLQTKKPERPTTPFDKATTHNNFYEFGTQKFEPAQYAQSFKVDPWTLEIGGEVENPQKIDVWELINGTALEERIYRFRCVEAWSMVIPWIGIELNQLLKKAQPTSKGKFVAFTTLYDPDQMPGQDNWRFGGGIEYPYVEGLRIDEAMHPLTMMVVGMYGKTLPPQNGAPLRLMTPWKYGFKSIKSIVKIELTEKMPPTTWNKANAREYGFYSNVNPAVDHPRWSQATERFIGPGGSLSGITRVPTLPFNGYAEEVAGLYKDMDLHKYY